MAFRGWLPSWTARFVSFARGVVCELRPRRGVCRCRATLRRVRRTTFCLPTATSRKRVPPGSGAGLALSKPRPPALSCSIPVHTIFDSCPDGSGIRAIAMTVDAKYLATISDAEIQVQGPWGWPQWAGRPVPGEQLRGPLLGAPPCGSAHGAAPGSWGHRRTLTAPSALSRTEGLHLEVDFGGGKASVRAGPSQRVRFSGEWVVSEPVTIYRRAKPAFRLSGVWVWGSRAL